jgi:hypothetical protein
MPGKTPGRRRASPPRSPTPLEGSRRRSGIWVKERCHGKRYCRQRTDPVACCDQFHQVTFCDLVPGYLRVWGDETIVLRCVELFLPSGSLLCTRFDLRCADVA